VERVCFELEIAPGTEAEYDERHATIWPEMSAAIRDAGLRNYSGFRRGTRVVYYGECHPDVATVFGRLGESEVNTRWAQSFEGVITRLVDDDGNLYLADEVFHQD
jgi:L-rhamnose mutarotase